MRVPVALALLATACVHTTTETRTKSVQVETSPPGAYVSVVEGSTERNLGTAPLQADLTYVVDRKEFDGACWAMPAIALGLTVASVVLATTAWSDSDWNTGLLIGVPLAGMAFTGFASSTLYCAIAAGTAKDRTSTHSYDLRARLAGHETQTVRTVVPSSDRERILLVPASGDAAP